MTMKIDANPAHWSSDVKTLGHLIVIVTTIVGSIGGGAWYLGGRIYEFAEAQTMMLEKLKMVQTQVVEAKTAAHEEGDMRERSIAGLRLDILPRIDRLEGAVQKAETEAMQVRTSAADMKEDLRRILDVAQRNLNVTESHGADIKATRDAVVGKDAPAPP